MCFEAPELVYIPSLEFGEADGLYDTIDGLVGDIYKQASMIKRLATHSGQEHYQVFIHRYAFCWMLHSFSWRRGVAVTALVVSTKLLYVEPG